jgi:hypothetical protein
MMGAGLAPTTFRKIFQNIFQKYGKYAHVNIFTAYIVPGCKMTMGLVKQ